MSNWKNLKRDERGRWLPEDDECECMSWSPGPCAYCYAKSKGYEYERGDR